MRYACRLTEHAKQRMRSRHISPWDALAALERRAWVKMDGVEHYYDPKSRVRVVVNQLTHFIITVYKT